MTRDPASSDSHPGAAACRSGPQPRTAAEALAALTRGHAGFRDWAARQRGGAEEPPASGLGILGLSLPAPAAAAVPLQHPFAIAVGCADARVPIRMLFGGLVNDIFEIRVAGQALGDECLGSIEYALRHLPSVKTIVVLGHTDCGAVRMTVDNHLKPSCLETDELSIGLRAVANHILGAVVQAERALRAAAPTLAASAELHRECLTTTAIVVNAAAVAHRLAHVFGPQGHDELEVVFGIYDLSTSTVLHPRQSASQPGWEPGLAAAPRTAAAVADIAAAAVAATLSPPRARVI